MSSSDNWLDKEIKELKYDIIKLKKQQDRLGEEVHSELIALKEKMIEDFEVMLKGV